MIFSGIPVRLSNVLLLIHALLLTASIRGDNILPPIFDLRGVFNTSVSTASSICSGFVPADQGSCNSCVVSALATILSIQACVLYGQNISFSPQHIWDCYDGACDSRGMTLLMEDFFPFVMSGPYADSILVQQTAPGASMKPSNYSNCLVNPNSSGTLTKARLLSVENHVQSIFNDPSTDSSLYANNNHNNTSATVGITMVKYAIGLHDSERNIMMMQHIMQKGPVMAIVTMAAPRFQAFSRWREPNFTASAFVIPAIQNRDPAVALVSHALTVIGWAYVRVQGGGTNETLAWIVQNSMGPSWGSDHGFGLIIGPLQQIWYGFELQPPPQGIVFNAFGYNGSVDEFYDDDEDALLFLLQGTDQPFVPGDQTFSQLKDDTAANNARMMSMQEDSIILAMTLVCMLILAVIYCWLPPVSYFSIASWRNRMKRREDQEQYLTDGPLLPYDGYR